MKKLIVLVAVLAVLHAGAQTIIPGGSVSGNWDKTGSPYLIEGSIMIPDNATLTIEPGVEIDFQGTYKLLVSGRLLASGTVADSIIFTAANVSIGWRGIRFDNTSSSNDSSKISFCKLQHGIPMVGTTDDSHGGAFSLVNFSKVLISNCIISNCTGADLGGGIYCNNSSPVIRDNKIINNSAGNGGGIFCRNGSSPYIVNNIISNNTSGIGGGISCEDFSPAIIDHNFITRNLGHGNGGGINLRQSRVQISNNTIAYNSCDSSNGSGGGIFSFIGDPSIFNNLISNNFSEEGGGMELNFSNSVIYDNIVCNNKSRDWGGGFFLDQSNPIFTNNTIVNNISANGGGMYLYTDCDPTLRNTILWGNSATTAGEQVFLFQDTSDPDFYYCNVEGGVAAFGLNNNFFTGSYQNSIDFNPLFVEASAGSDTSFNGTTANWALQIGSACVNNGDPTATYPATDIFGNPRIIASRIDMGAVETQSTTPINLLSFQTSFNQTENVVTCAWKTTNAINFSYFNIQRSSDGLSFATIGKVNSARNNNNIQKYEFADKELPFTNTPLVIYYRLQMIDNDGSFTYSEVQKVVLNNHHTGFTIAPNPAKTYTTVFFNKYFTDALIVVYDLQGRKLFKSSFSGTSYRMEVGKFPRGIYTLIVKTNDKTYYNKLAVVK